MDFFFLFYYILEFLLFYTIRTYSFEVSVVLAVALLKASSIEHATIHIHRMSSLCPFPPFLLFSALNGQHPRHRRPYARPSFLTHSTSNNISQVRSFHFSLEPVTPSIRGPARRLLRNALPVSPSLFFTLIVYAPDLKGLPGESNVWIVRFLSVRLSACLAVCA